MRLRGGVFLMFLAGPAIAVAAGHVDAVSRQADAGSTRDGSAVEQPIAPSSMRGKAGIDRFGLDTREVRESVQADGTVIVELNGEGMERITLTTVDGVPSMSCGSLLESRTDGGRLAPIDFRTLGRPTGGSNVDR